MTMTNLLLIFILIKLIMALIWINFYYKFKCKSVKFDSQDFYCLNFSYKVSSVTGIIMLFDSIILLVICIISGIDFLLSYIWIFLSIIFIMSITKRTKINNAEIISENIYRTTRIKWTDIVQVDFNYARSTHFVLKSKSNKIFYYVVDNINENKFFLKYLSNNVPSSIIEAAVEEYQSAYGEKSSNNGMLFGPFRSNNKK